MKLIPDRVQTPIAHAINSLSLTSKAILTVFVAIFVVSAGALAYRLNQHFLVEVPEHGGSLTIGIVGTPRLINPVLVQTEAGRSIVALVYAGLMKKDAEGNLVNDMAASHTISADNKEITFILKNNLFFHNDVALTSADVVFTINKIQDASLRSPRRTYWDGVKVEAIDAKTVKFTVTNRPMNEIIREMTTGILPEHLWKNVSDDEFSVIEYNTQPIGSGPYMIHSVTRGKGSLPTSYTLQPFSSYHGERAHIAHLALSIFQTETEALKALQNHDIESLGAIPPVTARTLEESSYRIVTRDLPRVFAVFFNQSHSPILADMNVRKALDLSTPREDITSTIFHGYAVPISTPFPAFMWQATSTTDLASSTEQAAKLLDKAGWVVGTDGVRAKTVGKSVTPLAFSIATSDVPDLKDTANLLKEVWGKLGITVTVAVYESGDLNQHIIRERDYDALLFGQVISEESDLYAFWHSSERRDPGLNVSLYVNPKVDKLLETMRTSTSTRKDLYGQLEDEFSKDVPAVFLYSPEYIEALPANLKGYSRKSLRDPGERFLDTNEWYLRTEFVWPWFVRK